MKGWRRTLLFRIAVFLTVFSLIAPVPTLAELEDDPGDVSLGESTTVDNTVTVEIPSNENGTDEPIAGDEPEDLDGDADDTEDETPVEEESDTPADAIAVEDVATFGITYAALTCDGDLTFGFTATGDYAAWFRVDLLDANPRIGEAHVIVISGEEQREEFEWVVSGDGERTITFDVTNADLPTFFVEVTWTPSDDTLASGSHIASAIDCEAPIVEQVDEEPVEAEIVGPVSTPTVQEEITATPGPTLATPPAMSSLSIETDCEDVIFAPAAEDVVPNDPCYPGMLAPPPEIVRLPFEGNHPITQAPLALSCGQFTHGEGKEHVSNQRAIDFGMDPDTKVLAAHKGEVISRGWDSYGGGNTIKIRHDSGLITWYAHLSAFDVPLYAKVEAGQLIGRSGATGTMVTGPHLHFAAERTVGGVRVSVDIQGIPGLKKAWNTGIKRDGQNGYITSCNVRPFGEATGYPENKVPPPEVTPTPPIVKPSITLSPTTASVGTTINFSLSGFEPGEEVRIRAMGPNFAILGNLGTYTVNQDGDLTSSFVLAIEGNHTSVQTVYIEVTRIGTLGVRASAPLELLHPHALSFIIDICSMDWCKSAMDWVEGFTAKISIKSWNPFNHSTSFGLSSGVAPQVGFFALQAEGDSWTITAVVRDGVVSGNSDPLPPGMYEVCLDPVLTGPNGETARIADEAICQVVTIDGESTSEVVVNFSPELPENFQVIPPPSDSTSDEEEQTSSSGSDGPVGTETPASTQESGSTVTGSSSVDQASVSRLPETGAGNTPGVAGVWIHLLVAISLSVILGAFLGNRGERTR